MSTNQWIDTHNHLFVFTEDQQDEQVKKAKEHGLVQAVVCAGGINNFNLARDTAHRFRLSYAVGLHPLYLSSNAEQELDDLEHFIVTHKEDRLLVAIGECGLDGSNECSVDMQIQENVLRAQLKLSKKYGLGLSLHGRCAMDLVLKLIGQIRPPCGVIHAFNGSLSQAQRFIKYGFKLGYGGAMTYAGSLRIKKVLSELPQKSIVLETDCPDMPASWRRTKEINCPESHLEDICRYGILAAQLREMNTEVFSKICFENTLSAFPKLRNLV